MRKYASILPGAALLLSALMLDNAIAALNISGHSAVPTPVESWSALDYSLVVENDGMDGNRTGVILTDYVPHGTMYVPGTAGCDNGKIGIPFADRLIFPVDNIPVDDPLTPQQENIVHCNFQVRVKASGGAQVTNYFTVASNEDPTLDSTLNTDVTAPAPDPGMLQFSSPAYTVHENGGSVVIKVTRTGGVLGMVSVDYDTYDGSATAGGDYLATSGTLTWADGEGGTKMFVVQVLDDDSDVGGFDETDETVSIILSNPMGAATIGTQSRALLTILDNDGGQLLDNRGFETNSFEGWLHGNNLNSDGYAGTEWFVCPVGQFCDYWHMLPAEPAEGLFDVLNAFDGDTGYKAYLFQEVRIPDAGGILTFKDRIQSQRQNNNSTVRYYRVKIMEATSDSPPTLSNLPTVTLETLLNVHFEFDDDYDFEDTGWIQRIFDVSAYAGRTIIVYIELYIHQAGAVGPMRIQLDDFSLVPYAAKGGNDVVIDFGTAPGGYPNPANWITHAWMNNWEWQQIHPYSTKNMVTGNMDGMDLDWDYPYIGVNAQDELITDFGLPDDAIWLLLNNDIVDYDGWEELHPLTSEDMVTGDVNNTGQDEVIIDFGYDLGIWQHTYTNRSWIKLHPSTTKVLDPSNDDDVSAGMVTGNVDGMHGDDLIIDFNRKQNRGLWVRMNNTSMWKQLNALSPDQMAIGDIDGNGQDDLIADFVIYDSNGNIVSDYGVWVWMNDTWVGGNAVWLRLHHLPATNIITGDIDGDNQDEVIIDFGPQYGNWVFNNNRYRHCSPECAENQYWDPLSGTAAIEGVTADLDSNGQADVVLSFDSWGIWVYMNNDFWYRLHAQPASLMVGGNLDGAPLAVAPRPVSKDLTQSEPPTPASKSLPSAE